MVKILGAHVLLSVLLVAACQSREEGSAQRAEGPSTATTVQRCDSARAATVALDSLARLNPRKSEVYRYEADSAGVRIVTWPARDQQVVDGMAIVRVDQACRIASLVRTDSA